MELPLDINRQNVIKEKLIQSVLTDQLKLKRRDIISKVSFLNKNRDNNSNKNEYERVESEFKRDSIDYFSSLSSSIFDSFVCELGFEINEKELYRSIYFYYYSVFIWFVKDLLTEKEIKIFMEKEDKKYSNTLLDFWEFSFPRFINLYLLQLNPKRDSDKCKKIANMISFLSYCDDKIKLYCTHDINEYINKTLPNKIKEYEKDGEKDLLKDAIEELELKKKVFDVKSDIKTK